MFGLCGGSPSKYSLWCNYHTIGDGWYSGTLLDAKKRLSQYNLLQYDNTGEDDDDDDAEDPSLLLLHQRHKLKDHRRLQRIETMKLLFSAFVDRTMAYELPNHLGLVTFGSEVEQCVGLTPLLEDFRDALDNMDPNGETKLFDALAECGPWTNSIPPHSLSVRHSFVAPSS